MHVIVPSVGEGGDDDDDEIMGVVLLKTTDKPDLSKTSSYLKDRSEAQLYSSGRTRRASPFHKFSRPRPPQYKRWLFGAPACCLSAVVLGSERGAGNKKRTNSQKRSPSTCNQDRNYISIKKKGKST
jgi:hypothetical protein